MKNPKIIVMRGVPLEVAAIARYLVHGTPDLRGQLEQLDPIHHHAELAALTEAVARAFWHRARRLSRAERDEMALGVVYFNLARLAAA